MEAEEDLSTAAAREAWEETGLEELPEGKLVWVRDSVYEYAGRRVEVHEDWLVCSVEHFEPAPGSLTEFEKLSIRQFGWWSAAELLTSRESVYPPDLGTHLERLLMEGPPSRPIEIGK